MSDTVQQPSDEQISRARAFALHFCQLVNELIGLGCEVYHTSTPDETVKIAKLRYFGDENEYIRIINQAGYAVLDISKWGDHTFRVVYPELLAQ
jgi:hypothetical protein